MSVRERRRLAVVSRVKEGQITLKAASELMGVSYRQARRIWAAYQRDGDEGLVHGLRGRSGNRRTDPAVRQRAVELYREHYDDFGPTLAAEYLASRHDLVVDDQTLGRWLREAGLWRRRRKASKVRRRRTRRACFGELVQIDGSHHDWFEGRRSPCVLMVMIDDATGLTLAWFFEGETTEAAMMILRQWALMHGLPQTLYPDRDSIYRVNTKQADEIEARTGKRPRTQFGRAMDDLGVKLICAGSPQAKGRVERMNGTLQDRLLKALRLESIDTIEAANAYLDQTFLADLNARFKVQPADTADVHVATTAAALDQALCAADQRVAGKDHCVSWDGQVLQLTPAAGMAPLAGKRVTVRRMLDGQVQVHWRDQQVTHRELPARPKRPAPRPPLAERISHHAPPHKPPADHPWRQTAGTG